MPPETPTPARERIPGPRPGKLDPGSIIDSFANRMMYSLAKDQHTAVPTDVFQALAFAVRDRLMERWFQTQSEYYENDAKRVYYLSLEFLMGRALNNNIINLNAEPAYRLAMDQLGFDLDKLREREPDAGLGNGGLGRLAACFLDSAATLGLPFYGYGIRYEYGIFRQLIEDGFQVEAPDNWLRHGNPWEIARHDAVFPVQFYGRVHHYQDESGHDRIDWIDTETIYAMAYDMPIAGYRNDTVNSLRLWAAKSSREFDLAKFNSGDYVRAVEDKNQTENISKVLYPADDKYVGKELRLKQQYFFVSATLQDVLRRFRKKENRKWDELPDKVAIQLNDTHPAVAIPELMRVLVDRERLSWDHAWELSRNVFGFTNHTVLPEALESWSSELFGRLLPRHLQIVEEIDRRLRTRVQERFPGDAERAKRMALFTDDPSRSVRMANLAIAGSHSVNGVAALHTEILKQRVFRDFHELDPQQLNNKTNGITPRRWLLSANPKLAGLISSAIGEEWTRNLDELRSLTPFADDAGFRQEWERVRTFNKGRLATWLDDRHGFKIDAESLFDCQVKRIHEYKRQLLNVLHVISLYLRVVDGEEITPRTVMISGKAAPSYFIAKLIIRLVNAVGTMIGKDERASAQLRVLFLPNYGVSCAERIFPACDLSEQISTAGTEASGTGNMKAALNGALTMGTLDGANIEILEEVGLENMFIFGHTTEEITALRPSYRAADWIERSARLKAVIDLLTVGAIDQAHPGLFRPLVEILTTNDRYFHCADFDSYCEAQQTAEATFRDREQWLRKSILNVAGMGKFSSDRTVREYNDDIWKATPVRVKMRSRE